MGSKTHRNALELGYRLQWYRFDRVLGQGGFGITYLARDINLERDVAIKEYLPTGFSIREKNQTVHPVTEQQGRDYYLGLERFLKEARILAKFDHPNIVHVLAVFEANNTGYMVMAYEQGESLSEVLAHRISLSEDKIAKFILPIVDGLKKVHSIGFIHRDIKPANILIRANHSGVLLDFGSARQTLGRKTHTLTAILSPGYAPIEQYYSKGDEQGPWTDIYSLGATLFRCVVGSAPKDAVARSRAPGNELKEYVQDKLNIYATNYSTELLQAIANALQISPDDRPQSLTEWETDLFRTWSANALVSTDKKFDITEDHPTEQNPARPIAPKLSDKQNNNVSTQANRKRFILPGLLLAASVLATAYHYQRFASTARKDSFNERITASKINTDTQDSKSTALPTEDKSNTKWKTGLKAYELAHVTDAVKIFQNLADKGDVPSIFMMGAVNWFGVDRTRDEREGRRLINKVNEDVLKAANGGKSWAQTMLGVMYEEGITLPQDRDVAITWYRKAADASFPWGQTLLAELYVKDGIPQQDYKKALFWFRKAAENGFSRAQYALGQFYLQGKEINQDYAQAANWIIKAAEQGNAQAQLQAGRLYAGGTGVIKDNEKAMEWGLKAATQGFADAQFAVGNEYFKGKITAKDLTKAAKWYQLAAEQGQLNAQVELGNMYETGNGVIQNHEAAVTWYRRAVAQNDPVAQNLLGLMYRFGKGQLKDIEQAKILFRMSAEQGSQFAQYNLAALISYNSKTPEEDKEAFDWYKKSAEQNNSWSQLWLGLMFQSGKGVEKDEKAAINWIRKSAEQGYVLAQDALGSIYFAGRGVKKDFVKAAKWIRLAAEQGRAYSQAMLGSLYSSGKGVKQNYDLAFKWSEKAAIQGDPFGQYGLGLLYSLGQGVPQDYTQAYAWFNLAAVGGGVKDATKWRDQVESKLTPKEREIATILSREYFDKYSNKSSQPP